MSEDDATDRDSVSVERIGALVEIRIKGWTLILDHGDAVSLGTALLRVSM